MTPATAGSSRDIPPHGRAFISHAYTEESRVTELARLLPSGIEPIIFPKVDQDPRRAVSNGIVQQIRASKCLIHIDGGPESRSVWVSFERDYALRSKIPVFWYNPETATLQRDNDRAADLTAQLLVSERSFERAAQLMRWLISERSFSFAEEPTVLKMKEIPDQFLFLLERGVPMVWLIDSYLSSVFSLGYGTQLEEWDDSMRSLTGWQQWILENSIFARISEDWSPSFCEDSEVAEVQFETNPLVGAFAMDYGIDLVSRAAAPIDWNRADDLLVRLTMLAQLNSPFFSSLEGDEN